MCSAANAYAQGIADERLTWQSHEECWPWKSRAGVIRSYHLGERPWKTSLMQASTWKMRIQHKAEWWHNTWHVRSRKQEAIKQNEDKPPTETKQRGPQQWPAQLALLAHPAQGAKKSTAICFIDALLLLFLWLFLALWLLSYSLFFVFGFQHAAPIPNVHETPAFALRALGARSLDTWPMASRRTSQCRRLEPKALPGSFGPEKKSWNEIWKSVLNPWQLDKKTHQQTCSCESSSWWEAFSSDLPDTKDLQETPRSIAQDSQNAKLDLQSFVETCKAT